jgi:hypothetical protein
MDSPPTKQQIINLKSKHTRASNNLQYKSLEKKIDLLREYLFNHMTATNSTLRSQHKFLENISERVTRLENNTINNTVNTALPMINELENF